MTAPKQKVTLTDIKRTYSDEGKKAARALAASRPDYDWVVQLIDDNAFDPNHRGPRPESVAGEYQAPAKKRRVEVVVADSQTGTELIRRHTKCKDRRFLGFTIRRQDNTERENFYCDLPLGTSKRKARGQFRKVAAELAGKDKAAGVSPKVVPLTSAQPTSKAA